jgi:hypothetical protein
VHAYNKPSQALYDNSTMSYDSLTAAITHSNIVNVAPVAVAANTAVDHDTVIAFADSDQQQQQQHQHAEAADDVTGSAAVNAAAMGDTQQLVRDEHDAAVSTAAHEAERAGTSSSSSSNNSNTSDGSTLEQTTAVLDSLSAVAAQQDASTATATAAAEATTAAHDWADIVPTDSAAQQQQPQQQQQQQQQRRQQQYSSSSSVKLDFRLPSQDPCLYTHGHCDLTQSSDLFASWKTAYRGAVRDEIDDWWHDRLLLNSTATATATSSSGSSGAEGEQAQAQGLLFGAAAAAAGDGCAADGFTSDSYMYDLMPSPMWATSPSTAQHKVRSYFATQHHVMC